MNLGHSMEDLEAVRRKIGATSMDDVMKFLGGKEFAKSAQPAVTNFIGTGVSTGMGPRALAGRMAASPMARNALRLVPGLTAGFAALDAADIVAGNEGIGNKLADLGAGVIGGGIGLVTGGPLGAIAGFSGGKALMDSTQALLGMDRAAEQNRLAKSYQMMNSGGQF